jgi:hypothetical protein
MLRSIVLSLCFVSSTEALSQVPAKAISYLVSIDLNIYDPDYTSQTDSEDLVCVAEADVYYSDKKATTIYRLISKPIDYDLIIHSKLYDINSTDEYIFNQPAKSLLLVKDQVTKPRATGRKKTIAGYTCKEYTFINYQGIGIMVWVSTKLEKNICPLGNFSLQGTALEVSTSNGWHYLATDFSGGELNTDFFEIPKDYQMGSISIPNLIEESK